MPPDDCDMESKNDVSPELISGSGFCGFMDGVVEISKFPRIERRIWQSMVVVCSGFELSGLIRYTRHRLVMEGF